MKYQSNRPVWILSLLLLLLGTASGEEVLMQVLEPQDKSIHTEDNIALVLKLEPEKFNTITILINKSTPFVITPKKELDTYCHNVRLNPGDNRVHIRVYSNDKNVTETIRNIYYMAPLTKENKYPPKGYARTYFHNDKEEKRCKRCHDMSVNEKKNIAFIDVTKSNCYLCHKNITAKEEGHAPAENWLCTSCHSGMNDDNTTKGESKFTAPEPVMKSCLNCHTKTRELWKDKLYQHVPTALGYCDRCHNPHASQYHFSLRKPVWELCRTCHSTKSSVQVYLQRFKKLKDHPMDPMVTDKELTCATCHNPHVSDRAFFLQPTYSGDKSICQEKGR